MRVQYLSRRLGRQSAVAPTIRNAQRSFYTTPKLQMTPELIAYTQAGIESIHIATGLPWIIVIPSLALSARLLLVPLRLGTKNLLQRRADLTPIVRAWGWQFSKTLQSEQDATARMKRHRALLQQKQKELYARHQCGPWRLLPSVVCQMSVWLVLSETLRRMSGASEGLLTLLTSWFRTGTASIIETPMQQVPVHEEPLSEIASSSNASPIEEQVMTYVTEGLDHEGALWFTDLLVADPHGYLSALLATLFVTQIMLGGRSKTVGQVRLQRALVVLGLAMFPLTLNVPAAMMVYWISSMSFGLMIQTVLDWLRPLRIPKSPPRLANMKTKPS